MHRLVRAGGLTAAWLAGLAVLLAASGWLYLVGNRPSSVTVGPSIGDALPLDELSKHSAVPLSTFVAVWGCAALLLGLIARLTRAERLTAAILLALGVALWAYLESGTSLLIVRQVPAHAAFRSASGLGAVYLPAVLAGLAGALLARDRGSRPRAPFVLACLVGAAGVLDVLDGTLPARSEGFVEQLAPQAVHPFTVALVAPVGLVLILLAR